MELDVPGLDFWLHHLQDIGVYLKMKDIIRYVGNTMPSYSHIVLKYLFPRFLSKQFLFSFFLSKILVKVKYVHYKKQMAVCHKAVDIQRGQFTIKAGHLGRKVKPK